MKKIAVEKSLSNVKNYLSKKGYDVTELDGTKDDLNKCDAIIVTGQDSNFLGIEDTHTKAPIINATGLTVEDIHKQLENRLS